MRSRVVLVAQCFWFGSVPLRAYLPDGDIDICAFPAAGTNSAQWFARFQSCLEAQARDAATSELPVKNITVVNADVKILKALVGTILVDISVNKAGGIGALCFLEEVDRVIGKDHLFKRAILLIKAWWCVRLATRACVCVRMFDMHLLF